MLSRQGEAMDCDATTIIASGKSRNAGRDYYERCNFSVDEIREKLAHRVNHPDAETCDWCHTAGLPNDVDRCPVCRRNLAAHREERIQQLLAEAEQVRKREAMERSHAIVPYWIAFGSSVLLVPPMQLSWWDAVSFVLVVTAFGGFALHFGLFRAIYWVRDVARPWVERVLGLRLPNNGVSR